MKCELCGKNFVALGVHLGLKHKVNLDDYKREFGILLVTPLVDDSLSEVFSKAMGRRLKDPEYLEECRKQCNENAKKRIGKDSKEEMSPEGRRKIAERNKENNLKYLVARAPEVKKILAEKKTIFDVQRDLGMGAPTVKKIVEMGLAEYDKNIAVMVGKERLREAKKK